jgi:hypothetical protein
LVGKHAAAKFMCFFSDKQFFKSINHRSFHDMVDFDFLASVGGQDKQKKEVHINAKTNGK